MGDTREIQELECLIGGQPIGHKRGPIEDEILKFLGYGDRKMPEAQVRIGKIRHDLGDFATHQTEGGKFAQKNYIKQETKSNNLSMARGFGCFRFPPKGSGRFRLFGSIWFCSDFKQNAGRAQLEIEDATKYDGGE